MGEKFRGGREKLIPHRKYQSLVMSKIEYHIVDEHENRIGYIDGKAVRWVPKTEWDLMQELNAQHEKALMEKLWKDYTPKK